VELVHWLHQLLQLQDSDLHRVLRHWELDLSHLARDITRELDSLPRGATAVSDLSAHVEEAVQASPRPIILFIDEAHTLIGAGGSAGTGDAANLLKPALARGTLRTIAATTWAEYKEYIEKDPALTRRFQVVKVSEPQEALAVTIVPYVSLPDEMLRQIVRLQLDRIGQRVRQQHQVPFTYDDDVVSLVAARCTEVESGARMVDAILTHTVLPQISRELLTRLLENRAIRRIHLAVEDAGLSYSFD
jgi:ATP-dependent Clp protease ATP-binding subunit ClpA